MESDSSPPQQGQPPPSQGMYNRSRRHNVSRPGVRHAMVVINRMLRSPNNGNDVVRDRIIRAACVMNAAGPTETTFASHGRIDTAWRIAARLVRRLRS